MSTQHQGGNFLSEMNREEHAGAANAKRVMIVDSSGAAVSTSDTELPAAAALSDATANPTTPIVGAANEVFNGTTWDRLRSAEAVTGTSGTGLLGAGGLMYDGANWIRIRGVGAAGDGTANALAVGGYGYNGSTFDRLRAGAQSNATAATGYLAALGVGQYNATAPTITDTRYNHFQLDSRGNQKVVDGAYEVGTVFNAVLNDVDISVKASAGYLLSIRVSNINAAIRYLQIHNKATAPAGGDTPILSFPIPAGSATNPVAVTFGVDDFGPGGLSCSTGIAIGVSTAAATFTAATTTDHVVTGLYV